MPDQPGDVPYTCADVSKAYRMLGYKAKVPFDEGIKKTVRWYKSTYNTSVKEEIVQNVQPLPSTLLSLICSN